MWKLYEHPIKIHKAIVVVPDIGEHVETKEEKRYWTLEDKDADKAIFNMDGTEMYKYTVLDAAVQRCSELNERDYARTE